MLQHFNDCIKQAKSFRQQAVQMNIFTAVLCSLKVSYKLLKSLKKKRRDNSKIGLRVYLHFDVFHFLLFMVMSLRWMYQMHITQLFIVFSSHLCF
jgi:hypothetical protein